MMKIALPDLKALPKSTKRIAIGGAVAIAALLGIWALLRLSNANATPPSAVGAAGANATTTTSALSTAGAPAPPVPMSATVHIEFTTYPAVNATVIWGKTILGRIRPHEPLVVERPRDSGPLDVIVRAPGYLAVHTRAHTFADSKLGVKLTRPDQKSTLFGYRAPIDAGTPLDLGPSTGTGGAAAAPPTFFAQPPQ